MTTPPERPVSAVDEQRARRRDRRLSRVVTVSVVVFTLAGFLGAVIRGRVQHPEKPINWLVVIGFVALIVVVDVLVMRFLLRRLMPLVTVSGVDSQATQRVSRQLRRGETVEEADRTAATAFLEITERQKWFPVIGMVLGLFFAFSAVLELTHTPPRPLALRLMNVVVALVVLGGSAYLFFNRRGVLTNGARQGLLPDRSGDSSASSPSTTPKDERGA